MNLKKFKERFNGAPMDLLDFAECAKDVDDNNALSSAARSYIDAMNDFMAQLEANEIEMG